MDFVRVDGAQGEGGGQILRTAVVFSAILGTPVRVERIRAGREVPGLKPQHISALRALSRVLGGELEGATEGSLAVTYVPGKKRLRSLVLDTGTAASLTLVLQAVIPAVALTGSRLNIELVGGTDVPWSPTFDYMDRVAREAYGRIGISFNISSDRRGYYPRGGGKVSAQVEPSAGVVPMDLTRGQGASEVALVSRCGSLPRHVAERQLAAAEGALSEAGISVASAELFEESSDSPGSSVLAYHADEHRYLGADGIGARGKPAEDVGRETASRYVAAARSGACLDLNLSDMVLPLLSFASEGSRVTVPTVTSHLRTGLDLAHQFTGCVWSAEEGGAAVIISIRPKGAK